MRQFRNILVGVNLAQGDRLVACELSPPNKEAVRRAVWLAKLNGAKVVFMYALDISFKAQTLLTEGHGRDPDVLEDAKEALGALTAQARREDVGAESCVVFGKSWVEIIRQVIRHGHDLVLVGTRNLSAVKELLFGSTAMKLLRKCPCPVWVTKPLRDDRFDSILVAHDLRPVGDLALDLGCSLAELDDAQLHVLHAAEFPELDYVLSGKISAESASAYRLAAERRLQEQLERCPLAKTPQVHYTTKPADKALLDAIEEQEIDLVIMGTLGRSSIPGLLTGNTAERLLPQIPCSVLAVKPSDFKSPITLENE